MYPGDREACLQQILQGFRPEENASSLRLSTTVEKPRDDGPLMGGVSTLFSKVIEWSCFVDCAYDVNNGLFAECVALSHCFSTPCILEGNMQLAFKRILLKLSGEALAGERGFGVDTQRIHEIASEIRDVHELGIEIALVVGGGNFFRGVAEQARDMDRVSADHMGMLATVINSLALQDALEKQDVYTRVMSALEMNQVAEPFIRRRALRHLEKGRVVIFAGGTGNPYFSTDTAASLRAMEIKADVIMKATRVDGVYDADPRLVTDAKMFESISYLDVLKRGLRVMDATAISLCRENNLPIVIFNLNVPGNIKRVVQGEKVGSLVSA